MHRAGKTIGGRPAELAPVVVTAPLLARLTSPCGAQMKTPSEFDPAVAMSPVLLTVTDALPKIWMASLLLPAVDRRPVLETTIPPLYIL